MEEKLPPEEEVEFRLVRVGEKWTVEKPPLEEEKPPVPPKPLPEVKRRGRPPKVGVPAEEVARLKGEGWRFDLRVKRERSTCARER